MKSRSPKRSREDAVLQDAEKVIRRLEREGDPVVPEARRLLESMKRAERVFEEAGRLDFANSVKAARLSLASHLEGFLS